MFDNFFPKIETKNFEKVLFKKAFLTLLKMKALNLVFFAQKVITKEMFTYKILTTIE